MKMCSCAPLGPEPTYRQSSRWSLTKRTSGASRSTSFDGSVVGRFKPRLSSSVVGLPDSKGVSRLLVWSNMPKRNPGRDLGQPGGDTDADQSRHGEVAGPPE